MGWSWAGERTADLLRTSRSRIVLQGGIYVVALMDWYVLLFSFSIISLFELIVIIYIYGERLVRRGPHHLQKHSEFCPAEFWSLMLKCRSRVSRFPAV